MYYEDEYEQPKKISRRQFLGQVITRVATATTVLVAGGVGVAVWQRNERDAIKVVQSPPVFGGPLVNAATIAVAGEAAPPLSVSAPPPVASSNVVVGSADIPAGRPIDPNRTDWVITQNNAAHWRNENISGLDYAYYGNTDAFGSAIVASHRGVVGTFADRGDGSGLGNGCYILGYVDPSTGVSYNTVYGHFQKVLVTEGQVVERGTVLGEMGSTGFSTGPHLHYEVWKCQRPTATVAAGLKPGEVNATSGEATRVDPEPFTV